MSTSASIRNPPVGRQDDATEIIEHATDAIQHGMNSAMATKSFATMSHFAPGSCARTGIPSKSS
jgi:hypothetical protein